MRYTDLDRAEVAAMNALYKCTDVNGVQYHRYGDRGICVQFPTQKAFAEYLRTLPGWDEADLWLDRTDNAGHYAPGNLRYVTPSESTCNRDCCAGANSYRAIRLRNKLTINQMSALFGYSTCAYSTFERDKLASKAMCAKLMLIYEGLA